MKLALSALVLTLSLAMPLHAAEPSAAAQTLARTEVLDLVTRFRHAIVAKDSEAMRGMFLPGGGGFRVLNSTSLTAVRAKTPDTKQFNPWSYEEFAKFLGTSPAALEETFDNVRVETDGTVGMVWFDYRFIKDGKQGNHGVETWQVVRDSDGWKISAMLFSVILDNS